MHFKSGFSFTLVFHLHFFFEYLNFGWLTNLLTNGAFPDSKGRIVGGINWENAGNKSLLNGYAYKNLLSGIDITVF